MSTINRYHLSTQTTRYRPHPAQLPHHSPLCASAPLCLCVKNLARRATYPAPDPPTRPAADLTETDVFTAGAEGYHTYRIPALVVDQKRHAPGHLRRPQDGPRRPRRSRSGPKAQHRRRQDLGTAGADPRRRRHGESHDRQSLPRRRSRHRRHLAPVQPRQRPRLHDVVERRRPDLDQAARHHGRRRKPTTGPGTPPAPATAFSSRAASTKAASSFPATTASAAQPKTTKATGTKPAARTSSIPTTTARPGSSAARPTSP